MSAKAIFQSHWASFLFLLPFVVLFALHNALGLSNAVMVLADDYPGRDKVFGMDVQLYNLIMCLAFIGGLFAFWMHAAYLFGGSKDKNRIWVFAAKTVFAGLFWAAILLLMQYTDSR